MALWTPFTTGLVFEHHLGTDLATSAYNHATGTTTASVNGTWTGGAGYQDISGTGPKGLDFGFAVTAQKAFVATVVDLNTGCCLIGSSGTTPAIAARARGVLDANPTAGQTISLNGQAITWRASGATGFEVNIGATPQATMQGLDSLINANPGTFATTSYNGDPGRNSLIEVTAITPGTAGNSIALSTGTTPNFRWITRNAWTSATTLGSGAAGSTVTAGIFHSGANLQGRNSNIGTGGLASVAAPAAANYHYISAVMINRNFAEIRLYSGGALAARSVGTTAGSTRAASGNLTSGLTGGGTGNAKQNYAACWQDTVLDDAVDLANYLAVQAASSVTIN